jgi:predicted nucleic acid-binding protein
MRTAIDTNIVSAIWTGEPTAGKIVETLARLSRVGGLAIAAPVYAELLAYPNATRQFVDDFLDGSGVAVDFRLDEEIWREAGTRFAKHATRRRSSRSGTPRRLLADFVIGAHALLRADRLLTLDVALYVKDFPDLRILTCEE